MLDPCGVDSNPLFVLGGYRVEEADALDEPSSASAAAVRDNHVVEGPAFRAGTGEPNLDHGLKGFLSLRLYRRSIASGYKRRSLCSEEASPQCLRSAPVPGDARVSPFREA